ncbi:MAG: MFS transporter [Eubacteriales bacterium]|nr:MFS transporter [Eubacteriales bacterium]
MKKRDIMVLIFGTFSILTTEMGYAGLLPFIADEYGVTLSSAGLLVSLFALTIAVFGPINTLLFSRFDRKRVMLLALGAFTVGNLMAAFSTSFPMLVVARVIPAFFHPVFISLTLSAVSSSVSAKEAPKAVSKVMMGVSAGSIIGSPVARTIANATSLRLGLLFFAAVSALALVATALLLTPFPAQQKLSYQRQLGILKRGRLWISVAAIVLCNGAMMGSYSYLSAYLQEVTLLPVHVISFALLAYGVMCLVGNTLGGRGLSRNPNRLVTVYPIVMTALLLTLFFIGGFAVPAMLLVLAWGVIGGIAACINQYWISTAAPDAPEFVNSLFLSSGNLGTAIGTSLCGGVIAGVGMAYVPLGSIALFVCGFVAILVRVRSKRFRSINTEAVPQNRELTQDV